VSNLFNRSLLSNFSVDEICVLLGHAVTLITTNADGIDSDLQAGLLARLEFRNAFLRAVMAEPRKAAPGGDDYWKMCLDHLAAIEATHDQAISVDDSFSIKIQRRLASTVPPRPIIQLEFSACLSFLGQLFTNAIDVVGVRECQRVSSIMVSRTKQCFAKLVNLKRTSYKSSVLKSRHLLSTFAVSCRQ
jgi:N-alpha-acetyltransferase 35, NatC auxiliary subunit